MADMVAALLETARARLKKGHLDPAPIDLGDLLARVEPRWECARPDIALTISCASDCALEGDDDQISLAVNALIGLAAGVARDLPREGGCASGGSRPRQTGRCSDDPGDRAGRTDIRPLRWRATWSRRSRPPTAASSAPRRAPSSCRCRGRQAPGRVWPPTAGGGMSEARWSIGRPS